MTSAGGTPAGRSAIGRPYGNIACEVWFADLAHSASALAEIERASSLLTSDETSRAEVMSRGAGEWLASRIALRLVIQRWADQACARQPFMISARGKPSLAGDGAPHFSVSHTGGAVLIGISAQHQLGVDLETSIRTVTISEGRRERIKAAARVLCGEVALRDAQSLQSNADEEFLQAWVILEAASKAMGTGIGPLLTKIGATGSTIRIDPISAITEAAGGARAYTLALPRPYCGAVACADGAKLQPSVFVFANTAEDIFKQLAR